MKTNIYPRVYMYYTQKGRKTMRYATLSKWRRFVSIVSRDPEKYLTIRVEYGYQKDHNNKNTLFINEGTYTTAKDAKQAFYSFIEDYK